jgi:outer membrane protein TolC
LRNKANSGKLYLAKIYPAYEVDGKEIMFKIMTSFYLKRYLRALFFVFASISVLFIVFLIFTPRVLFAANFAGNDLSCEIRLMDVIRSAIEKDATVKVYKSQQNIAAAGELSAMAAFDPQLKASVARSSDYTPISETQKKSYSRAGFSDVTKLKQGALSYSVGYEKRYRSGISISPAVTVSTGESNDPQNRQPVTSGKIQFAVIKPLAQGRDSKVNTAYEKSSRIEIESASLDSLYAVSQTVHKAVAAYWNYVYSYKAFQIAQKSKQRAEKLYNDTKTLVEGSEVAPSELDQLTANLNQKLADCERASQALLQSKNELKIVMGVTRDLNMEIGPPADFFPVERILNGTIEVERSEKKLIEFAAAKRKDYLAAQKRLEAYKFTIPAARDALKPKIDLQMAAGYNGRKDDKGAAALIAAMHDNVPGVNVSATLSYSFPIGNKSAKAGVIRQEEQYYQAKIKAEEIERQIGINIGTRVNAVASIIRRYKQMAESERLYEKAIENEKEKNRMGVSTLLDIVNLEDRLGQAELSLESAVLEFASAVADLRFEAGCLGIIETGECEIKVEDVIAMPEVISSEK